MAANPIFSMTSLQSHLPVRCEIQQTAISEQPRSDMNDDPGIQLIHARKRTHRQMSEESYNHDQSSWRHHFHPPRPSPSPDRLPPLRYAGDGYDFRRPAGAATPQEEDVIDLTNEPETPPQRFQPRTSDPRAQHSTRLPRFGRDIMAEVVDLEDEPDTPAAGPSSSPEVQIVGSQVRQPSGSRRSWTITDEHLPRMLGMHTRSHPHTPFMPGLPPNDPRRIAMVTWNNWRHLPPREAREIETLFIGDRRPSLDFILDSDELNLDYRWASGQFPLRPPLNRPDSRLPPDTYKAPSPAPEGFTRTLAEDDMAICPNCNDELGAGEGSKQQIWIAKPCGHVYCGECTENRSVSKTKKYVRKNKPFSKCQVAGCGKTVSAPTAMIHLFL